MQCNEDIDLLFGIFAVLEFPIGQWQDPGAESAADRNHLTTNGQSTS